MGKPQDADRVFDSRPLPTSVISLELKEVSIFFDAFFGRTS